MNKKIFVATPMYGGQCAGYYTQSIMELNILLQKSGVEAQYSFMFNESLITRARNALTNGFLKSGCTHLLFIDSDIKFRATDIMAMLEADKDIICGIYPKKEINWDSVKKAMDAGVPQNQLKSYTGSFVVNLVDESLSEAMNKCAASLPYGVDELQQAGLHPLQSSVVKPPRIAEAPASLECKEWGTLNIGDNRVVIGLVKRVHLREELFDAEKKRVRSDKLFLIGRMASPHWYCKTRDRFEIIRPE